MSNDELNLTLSFKAKALPFNPVTSFGLYLLNSGKDHPVFAGSYFQLSNKITPYKFVDLFPELDLEYLEIVSIENLHPIDNYKECGNNAACIAVTISSVRLIDNIIF